MRTTQLLNNHWRFTHPNGGTSVVNLPHTWNAEDGQDGGNDYCRGTGIYQTTFPCPEFNKSTHCVYLEFAGVNASASVTLNGQPVMCHDGGYSTFRKEITSLLQEQNTLVVEVDNAPNHRVYPQKADFTFYGGIYRDVKLIVLHKHHFDMDYFGGNGLAVTPGLQGSDGIVQVQTWVNQEHPRVQIALFDRENQLVASGEGTNLTLTIPNARLWDGLDDPYLYRCEATLLQKGFPIDRVSCHFGIRSLSFHPKEGFFLNGRSYPLHGVSRHQDRKGIGNALRKEHHDEDMSLILEIGANTVRLAHYQHDQYFYDLCDRHGLTVWAEIPYISQHMPAGRGNTVQQMKELIVQNYHHPSIITWGISNEITISTKDKKDMLRNHRILNHLVHQLDPTRPTSLACYAVCSPFHKVAHMTDLVSWNLYLGWYVPGLFLNNLWIDFFSLYVPQPVPGLLRIRLRGDAQPSQLSPPTGRPHRGISGKIPRIYAQMLPKAPIHVVELCVEHV